MVRRRRSRHRARPRPACLDRRREDRPSRCSTSGPARAICPRAAVRWAATRGIRTRTRSASSVSPVAARLAADEWPALRGRLRRLSRRFGPRSVDVVLVSQVAHHLDPEARRAPASRTATGWPVGRSSSPTCGAAGSPRAVLGRPLGCCGSIPSPVADGMTSIRRGFTERRAAWPLRAAGIEASVVRRPGFRFLVTWRTASDMDANRRSPSHAGAAGEGVRRPPRTSSAGRALLPHYRWVRHAGAAAGRGRRRDGGVATVRSAQVSDLVGVGNVGGSGPRPRCATGTSAASPRAWTWSGGSSSRVKRPKSRIVHEWTGPALAADREGGRDVGDRSGLHAWHRLADAGGHPSGGGGATMSEPRRVVITGIGAITPIGHRRRGPLGRAFRQRASAVRYITRFDPSRVPIADRAPRSTTSSPTDHIEERRVRRLDRYSQFSVAATRLALADAGSIPRGRIATGSAS